MLNIWMFITRMPSTAKPRSTSSAWRRSDSETGAAAICIARSVPKVRLKPDTTYAVRSVRRQADLVVCSILPVRPEYANEIPMDRLGGNAGAGALCRHFRRPTRRVATVIEQCSHIRARCRADLVQELRDVPPAG